MYIELQDYGISPVFQASSSKESRERKMNDIGRKHYFNYRIPLYEIDLGNALYHGNYFHLFELARDDFWRTIGFPYAEIMANRMHLTIVESHCKYRKPLRYDEVVQVVTGVKKIGSRSLVLHQRIFRDGGRELCTEATISMVCVTFEGKPVRLPEDFRRHLEKWVEEEKQ